MLTIDRMHPGAIYPAQVAERVVEQLQEGNCEITYSVELGANPFYARVKAVDTATGEEVGYF